MAKVFSRRPLQLGPEEIVFPARYVKCPEDEPITVEKLIGDQIIARYGPAGVIEIPEPTTPDELPEFILQARRLRYSHLRKQLDDYRMEQGRRQAQGIEIMMPSNALRSIFMEAKALRTRLLEEDPIMRETMPSLPGEKPAEGERDVLAEELAQFGITPKSAPLQPGVTIFDQEIPI
jgi:hypothetical protein